MARAYRSYYVRAIASKKTYTLQEWLKFVGRLKDYDTIKRRLSRRHAESEGDVTVFDTDIILAKGVYTETAERLLYVMEALDEDGFRYYHSVLARFVPAGNEILRCKPKTWMISYDKGITWKKADIANSRPVGGKIFKTKLKTTPC